MLGRLRRDASTGVCVGLTDIALVYPLAVLATRRENGLSMRSALGQGRLHSGALTAGTLLIPYSVLVETMSQQLQAMQNEANGGSSRLQMLGAAAATSLVASVGVQPIEKKLVMDQMLENQSAAVGRGDERAVRPAGGAPAAAVARQQAGARHAAISPLLQPLREILEYKRRHGLRALFGGFTPLLAREFIYIAAITAVNPVVSSWAVGNERSAGAAAVKGDDRHRHLAVLKGGLAAFSVGCTAGVLSAPCQTLNAMMKSESHRCTSMSTLVNERDRLLAVYTYTIRLCAPADITLVEGLMLARCCVEQVRGFFAQGWAAGVHRLYFGAMTRSVRCGGAGVLYFGYRRLNGGSEGQ
jgi:hypothetical protein